MSTLESDCGSKTPKDTPFDPLPPAQSHHAQILSSHADHILQILLEQKTSLVLAQCLPQSQKNQIRGKKEIYQERSSVGKGFSGYILTNLYIFRWNSGQGDKLTLFGIDTGGVGWKTEKSWIVLICVA